MTRYFVDQNGLLIGCFAENTETPLDGIEVFVEPPSGDMIFVNGQWVEDPARLIAIFTKRIDGLVEETARSRNYNSAAHIASYVASTVSAWASEAQAFVAWRDQVWLAAFGVLQNAQATNTIPTWEDIETALPVISWPS